MDIQHPHSSKGIEAATENIQRVMIVDDHEVYRFGLRELLADIASFRVVAEVGNCGEALLRLHSMPIDLVLLDLNLPDVSGLDALHRIKAMSPRPDIIIISATIDDTTLLDALLAGISGYLTKDIPASGMLDALLAYQRGELALPTAIALRAIQLLLQHTNILENELTSFRQDEAEAAIREAGEDVQSLPQLLHMAQGTRKILPQLTPQEEKVYRLMRKGKSNKQIAAELIISRFTVGKHVQNILRKLGATNRTQAVFNTQFEGEAE